MSHWHAPLQATPTHPHGVLVTGEVAMAPEDGLPHIPFFSKEVSVKVNNGCWIR